MNEDISPSTNTTGFVLGKGKGTPKEILNFWQIVETTKKFNFKMFMESFWQGEIVKALEHSCQDGDSKTSDTFD